MSDTASDAVKAPTQNSAVTVLSPEKVKPKAQASTARHVGHVRTERPVDPPNPTRAFVSQFEESATGNPNLILSLKLEGQLSVFYPRSDTTRTPELITVNFPNIRGAAERVITFVLTELVKKKKELDNPTATRLVRDIAVSLSNGICVMTYMKLRNVNYHDTRVSNRYRIKAKVPSPFEIPSPYALAISQLGAIKLSGMSEEVYLTPTVPAGSDTDFGCSLAYNWSPVDYSKNVVLAKDLGLRFSSVDLDVKLGSSWWLYRPISDGDAFRFDCPYPEENFTLNTTVLAGLFANTATGGFSNPIIDIGALGDRTFCSMLRKPPSNLSMNCYYAINEETEVVYLVSG